MSMSSALIVGGGVIGLSIAYELARRGEKVTLLDRDEPGRGTSWAGAGILPPPSRVAQTPYDELCRLSFDQHPEWTERLQRETGIDTGYRRCGGLYLADNAGEAAALRGAMGDFAAEQIAVETLKPEQLATLEPGLAEVNSRQPFRAAYRLPEECQLRNPRHLKALRAACERLGVEIVANANVDSFEEERERLTGAITSRGTHRAENIVIATGSWTPQLLAKLGLPRTPIVPIRGQMLLYKLDRPPLTHVVNIGPRYLVPRDDGHLLVGSTEEEAGYDQSTTESALNGLRHFAGTILSELKKLEPIKSWAGLRPMSLRGAPYLGRLPGWENAFLAAGHFRSGIYLSPGTAIVMADLLQGKIPPLDLAWFGWEQG